MMVHKSYTCRYSINQLCDTTKRRFINSNSMRRGISAWILYTEKEGLEDSYSVSIYDPPKLTP